MKINGLDIDVPKIANGLYDMVCEAGESHIVAFGMVPFWVYQITERQLKELIIRRAATQDNTTVEAITPFISNELVQNTVQPIMHKIIVGIFQVAKERNKMIC